MTRGSCRGLLLPPGKVGLSLMFLLPVGFQEDSLGKVLHSDSDLGGPDIGKGVMRGSSVTLTRVVLSPPLSSSCSRGPIAFNP